MAGTMVLSMAACGGEEASTPDPTQAPTPTEAPADEPTTEPAPAPVVEDASVNFEDGNMGFLQVYTGPANADASELSIVDYNGSKAVKVTNTTGKVPYIGIDASSLLGADVAKVASMELSIGVENPSGKFAATSGKIFAWSGADLVETSDNWSVYLESANPKKAVAKLSAGEEFVADANNIFIINLDTDNAASDGLGSSNMYIDNIRFLDKDGNLLTADSSVAFAAPEGFVKTGQDLNLCYLDNAVELDGFAVSAGGWAQAGIDLTDEQRAMLVPGSVIEISYKCDEPVWMVAIGENPLGGWLRAVDQNTFVVDGAVSEDNGTVQYTYEQLAAYWGEDFGQYVGTLQCEGKADWEVYNVTVGMAE